MDIESTKIIEGLEFRAAQLTADLRDARNKAAVLALQLRKIESMANKLAESQEAAVKARQAMEQENTLLRQQIAELTKKP